LRYSIPTGTPYVDFASEGGVSTTLATASVLFPLLGPSGVLASFPSIATPIFTGSTIDVYAKVRVHSVLVSQSVRGSEGTALVAADLYNRLRCVVWSSPIPYLATKINPLETSTERWPNMVDVSEILMDLKFDLPTVSIEQTSGYNAPAMRTYRQHIPVNRTFDCYTQTNTGTTAWDTKNGDLLFSAVSDSSVLPHPTQSMNIRMFYEIIR
jgi:hypothetical protein